MDREMSSGVRGHGDVGDGGVGVGVGGEGASIVGSGGAALSGAGKGPGRGRGGGGGAVNRKLAAAEAARRVLARADALPEADRALVVAVLDRGQRLGELAVLMGETPKALARRLRRVCKRALTPSFEFVRQRRSGGGWPPSMARAATLLYLHGFSQSQTAAAMGTTLHAVRGHALAIRAMMLQAGASASASPSRPVEPDASEAGGGS